ncbi:helix-turn-helix domain-containing protein [Epilithonimonas sp.]|uniref:helix-turn-helix domain-containing protein n=1 Tax=Epilithonimonas sp. TaxID=2894511 RepID=UPI0028993E4C|nr:helix-turn-helix domain-containing protein [Epilithonimonas sp.]
MSLYQKNWRKIFIFLITIIFAKISAQNPEEYNKIYTKTYIDISQKDFPKALKIADSLFSISETPRFKVKSLMLSASLLQQSGDIKKAIGYAVRAQQISNDNDDFIWKAKISGFLASQYRQLKLFEQSKKYIDETTEATKKISDQKIVDQTMGFIMQEKAYYELEMKDYKKSISYVLEAQKYFDLNGQTNPFVIANNNQLLGLIYYRVKEYDKALDFYDVALKNLEQMQDNFMKALVLNGIAKIFIAKKDVKQAKKRLDEAKRLAEESPYLSLKNEVYETSQEYYSLTRDIDKLQESKIKQDSIVEKISTNSSSFISDSVSKLIKKNDDIKKETEKKSILIWIALLFIISGITYFFLYRKKQKNKFDKVIQAMEKQKKAQDLNIEIPPKNFHDEDLNESSPDNQSEDPEQNMMMTPATEKKILLKLEKFEQSKLFTRSTVSLPYLASYCNTNTKYLSYVVNTYKKKDFKNYINELRIKYIIDKLKNDPQYHKYKISTLAEEVGFSSQSKFAAAFRKITELSPSQFIEHLKKNPDFFAK